VSFTGVDGKRTDRQLFGFKSMGPKDRRYKRFYHYGLEAQPVTYPQPALALKSHVIFTLDGNTPHRDLAYQHRSRRNQCWNWWNDRWRDLMLAAVTTLADGRDEFELPLCPAKPPRVGARPIEFKVPVSYRDEDVKEPNDEQVATTDEIEDSDEEADDGDDPGPGRGEGGGDDGQ
jgi:hypothetical protein